jgi:hypothetical protein
MLAHNGEINTLRGYLFIKIFEKTTRIAFKTYPIVGNVNFMKAREVILYIILNITIIYSK